MTATQETDWRSAGGVGRPREARHYPPPQEATGHPWQPAPPAYGTQPPLAFRETRYDDAYDDAYGEAVVEDPSAYGIYQPGDEQADRPRRDAQGSPRGTTAIEVVFMLLLLAGMVVFMFFIGSLLF